MKITIHQPNFLPYLGFFDKCDYADILVLYDSTQFKKNDYQNRNNMATEIKSIPVLQKNEAKQFEAKAESNMRMKATIDFSISLEKSKAILAKAKLHK